MTALVDQCRCMSGAGHKKKKDTAVLERGKGGSTAYGAMAEGVSVAEDVYTSTYFSLTEGEVENFVRRRKLDYKNSPDNVTLKVRLATTPCDCLTW